MTYTRTTWVDNTTLVDANKMNNIETELALLDPLVTTIPPPTYSATPPGSPVNGQIWFLPADATNGVIWQFRYNSGSASAYKWEFVGGPPYFSYVGASEVLSGPAVWATTATNCVSQAPRTGDYLLTGKAVLQPNAANAQLFLGVANNNVSTTPLNDQGASAAPPANGMGGLVTVTKATAFPGGSVMILVYYSSTAGTNAVLRSLSVLPIRVS